MFWILKNLVNPVNPVKKVPPQAAKFKLYKGDIAAISKQRGLQFVFGIRHDRYLSLLVDLSFCSYPQK